MSLEPTRLVPFFREMPWGVTNLEPWFSAPPPGKSIGEVWFSCDQVPILVKFIFTSDRLSIQVHPGDADAALLEGTSGKTEMWHILRAEPGARIALGPCQAITREQLREAALSGEIERLVRFLPLQPGETYFVYPGTIHTIGPGVVLCEIQQNIDLTYRLYDYGRPRQLHLEKAVQVAELRPHPGPSIPVSVSESATLLASCPYFATERWELTAGIIYRPDPQRSDLLVALEGSGNLGAQPFAPGQVWLIPAAAEPFLLQANGSACLLRTYVP
jgi:mannose-6-phosphate isomerase